MLYWRELTRSMRLVLAINLLVYIYLISFPLYNLSRKDYTCMYTRKALQSAHITLIVESLQWNISRDIVSEFKVSPPPAEWSWRCHQAESLVYKRQWIFKWWILEDFNVFNMVVNKWECKSLGIIFFQEV